MYILPHWALGPPAGSLSIRTWFTFAMASSRRPKALRAARVAGVGGKVGSTYLVLFSRQFLQAIFSVLFDCKQYLPGVKVPHSSQALDNPKRPHLRRKLW